jgi:hypothetical protein
MIKNRSPLQSVPAALVLAMTALLFPVKAPAADQNPDITGIWIGIGAGRPDIDSRWRNKAFSPAPEFTRWGAEESRKLGRLGTETGTPGSCNPVHPVQFMSAAGLFPLQVLRGSNQIVILNEWVAVPRRIYIDGRGHPTDLDPSWEGHSIGRWEGDALRIDTIGFNGRARPINGYAANAVNATSESIKIPRLPASEQMHLEERVRLVGDGRFLEVETTVTDPKTYVRSFTSVNYFERRPDIDMQEYFCSDNVRTADEGHTEKKRP